MVSLLIISPGKVLSSVGVCLLPVWASVFQIVFLENLLLPSLWISTYRHWYQLSFALSHIGVSPSLSFWDIKEKQTKIPNTWVVMLGCLPNPWVGIALTYWGTLKQLLYLSWLCLRVLKQMRTQSSRRRCFSNDTRPYCSCRIVFCRILGWAEEPVMLLHSLMLVCKLI